ncbi:hypothetical protein VNI00_012227 [Paramarasmius palmivorus]|uniref:Hydrophobic surface binding protein n=1 Tax=Paramarasmius palmivorus TaxID=297713 RepID=A0AAW0C7W3_9AGAR
MAPVTSFLVSLLVASQAAFTSAAPFEKRTVEQVKADIATISSQVATLNKNIQAFPNSGGSISGALAIHSGAITLANSISKGTADVKNTTGVSSSDAQSILQSVQGFEPTIKSALDGIAAKKPAFDAMPIGGISKLAKQDLATLGNNTSAFAQQLVNSAPTNMKSTAQSIANDINAAFAKAQAVYANV